MINKKIQGKNYNFGTYNTIEEAKKYRNYFESTGWNVHERLQYSTSKNNPDRYITIQGQSYRIIKKIDGQNIFFGTYYSLEKARRVRDYFESTGWNVHERLHFSDILYVSETNGKYMIRKTLNGKRVLFSEWKDKESAIEEARLLKRCNWDLDALCEGIDETVDGELKFLDGVKKGGSTFQTHPKGRDDSFMMRRI